jgi:hypothetical protein
MRWTYGRSWVRLHLLSLTGQGQQHAGAVSVRMPVQWLLVQRERGNRTGWCGGASTTSKLCSHGFSMLDHATSVIATAAISQQAVCSAKHCCSDITGLECLQGVLMFLHQQPVTKLPYCTNQSRRCHAAGVLQARQLVKQLSQPAAALCYRAADSSAMSSGNAMAAATALLQDQQLHIIGEHAVQAIRAAASPISLRRGTFRNGSSAWCSLLQTVGSQARMHTFNSFSMANIHVQAM